MDTSIHSTKEEGEVIGSRQIDPITYSTSKSLISNQANDEEVNSENKEQTEEHAERNTQYIESSSASDRNTKEYIAPISSNLSDTVHSEISNSQENQYNSHSSQYSMDENAKYNNTSEVINDNQQPCPQANNDVELLLSMWKNTTIAAHPSITSECRKRVNSPLSTTQNSSLFCKRYRGIYEKSGRWNAQIQHQGKKYYLGSFDTREAAALQYDRAALKYHGDHAVFNFDQAPKSVDDDTMMYMEDTPANDFVTDSSDKLLLLLQEGDEKGKQGIAEDDKTFNNLINVSDKESAHVQLSNVSCVDKEGEETPHFASLLMEMRSMPRLRKKSGRDVSPHKYNTRHLHVNITEKRPLPAVPVVSRSTRRRKSAKKEFDDNTSCSEPVLCDGVESLLRAGSDQISTIVKIESPASPCAASVPMTTEMPSPTISVADDLQNDLHTASIKPLFTWPLPTVAMQQISSSGSSICSELQLHMDTEKMSQSGANAVQSMPFSPFYCLFPDNTIHICWCSAHDFLSLSAYLQDKDKSSRDFDADMADTAKSDSGVNTGENDDECEILCSSLKSLKRPNHSKFAKTMLMKWLTTPSHFFNPYPCATTKRALAMETNLREDQIANWFVNTRKRFLTPIIADIQRQYGIIRLDSVITKKNLYDLLKDMLKSPGNRNYNVQWISSFLADTNFCWHDENG